MDKLNEATSVAAKTADLRRLLQMEWGLGPGMRT